MHRVLKLQHHRHSGKLLPHHHTSYRALGLLLAIVGVFLYVMQQNVGADSLYVYAKNPAALPSAPAIILSPDDGFQTSTGIVEVSGTCPSATPPNIVVILENSTAIASTPCLPDDTFAVTITLQAGTRVLSAQIFNITEDPGPSSPSITAIYTPPTPPSPPVDPTPVPPSPNEPTTALEQKPPTRPTTSPVITTERPFFTYGPNSPVTWEGSISGGVAPYTITLNWGDGSSTSYEVSDASKLRYSHYYREIDTYYITVTIQDATGTRFTNTYAAVSPYVEKDGQTDVQAPSGIQNLFPGNGNMTRTVIFTLYGVATLLVGLIWFEARYIRPMTPALQHIPAKRKPHRTSRNSAKITRSSARKR